MRKALGVVCLAALLSCLILGLASGKRFPTTVPPPETTIDKIGVYAEPFYVVTDPVVATVTIRRSGKEFDDPPGNETSVSLDLQRAVCWRLDSGNGDDVNWGAVAIGLREKFGVGIADEATVCVTATPDIPACRRATVDVYTCYSREVYRVEQGGHVALVSVLTPGHGCALVYREFVPRDGGSVPQSAGGACATVRILPSEVRGCVEPMTTGPRLIPLFPVPQTQQPEEATWGAIKALLAPQ